MTWVRDYFEENQFGARNVTVRVGVGNFWNSNQPKTFLAAFWPNFFSCFLSIRGNLVVKLLR